MKIAKNKLIMMLICFAIAEITLCVLVVGHFTDVTIWLEYSAIILCLIFTLVFALNSKLKWIQVSAFIFTLIADAGLVLHLYGDRTIAVAIFCLAQISYFVLILFSQKNKKINIANIILVGLIVTILEVISAIVLKANFDFLVFFTTLYLSVLISNVIFSGINVKRNPFLFVGLILFICCDIIIGFASAGGYIDFASVPFIAGILNAPFDIATTFYLTSQFFITLAIILNRNSKN